jgi:hypothetical protein
MRAYNIQDRAIVYPLVYKSRTDEPLGTPSHSPPNFAFQRNALKHLPFVIACSHLAQSLPDKSALEPAATLFAETPSKGNYSSF